jgi:single-strand DNA-binding protein
MLNRVLLIGNLTRDPEVRYLPSGVAVTTFDIAVNERYRDRNQEMREETLFIRIETFQKLAETCAQYLKKGRRVFAEGKLRMDQWEGKDGVKHSRPVIRAQNIQFLDSKAAEGAAAPATQPARPVEKPRVAEPAEADQPLSSDVPEYDMNAEPTEPGPAEPSTNDDLPF